MNTTIAATLAAALIATPLAVAGGFPGLPGQAGYGICNAYDHIDENATQAPPFQNVTADECGDDHPRDRADDRADERAANATADADEDAGGHEASSQAGEDGRAYGQERAQQRGPG